MYVDPFIAGIVATVMVELLLLVVTAIYFSGK